MVSPNCAAAISNAAGKDLSQSEVEAIEKAVLKEREARRAKSFSESDPAAFAAAAKSLADETKLAALIEKRSRAINVQTKLARFAAFDAKVGKELHAVRQMIEQVHGRQGGTIERWLGALQSDLEKAGLLKILGRKVGPFDRDVARELWRISDNTAPASGNKNAEAVAKILNKYQEQARLAQNDAGAWIGKENGYIARQSHDSFKMGKAGFERWRDSILPKLDAARTFEGTDDANAFLKAVYRNLVSGDHQRANGSEWLMGFKGPGNMAKKASAERVLHFKSADDWFAYNNQFGTGSMMESIVKSLEHAARNSEIMRVYGTNPRAAFDSDIKQLVSRVADRKPDDKQISKLKNWFTAAMFGQIDGTAMIAESPRLAHWAGAVRAMQSMSKLGKVVFSSFPDVAVNASTLRNNGVPLFEAYGASLRGVLGAYGKDRREIAALLGVGVRGHLGSMLHRFHAGDTLPGVMSKMMDTYYRLNLLNWWTENKKIGVGLMLSRNLASNADREFAKLAPELRTSLERYGIDDSKWNLIRQGALRLAENDKHLTPDAMQFLPDDAVRAHLGGKATDTQIAKTKNELESMMSGYYFDQVATSMSEGGAAERAALTLGTKRGTAVGEAVRLMTQFKMFSMSFANRGLRETYNQRGVFGVAELMATATLLGYASITAKDFLDNKTPRKFDNAQHAANNFLAALVQGGGLGIYGDFLTADYNRFGGGAIETLGGPTVGTFGDVLRLFGIGKDPNVTAESKKKQLEMGGVHFLQNNVPPFSTALNMFYTKAALDYLFMYHLQDKINPGYLQRREKKMQTETGQRFILRPQS